MVLCYGSPRKQIHSRTELWGCWPSPPHLHPWVVLPVDHAERIMSVVLTPAPAAVQHLRAAAGVLCRCVRAEPSQQCCLSCQTGCRTTASEALAGALAMANLSSYTSRLPEPPLQLAISHYFDYCNFAILSEVWKVILPNLFFFLPFALVFMEFLWLHTNFRGFPVASDSKDSTCNAGDLGLIPGLARSSGEGNGNPL